MKTNIRFEESTENAINTTIDRKVRSDFPPHWHDGNRNVSLSIVQQSTPLAAPPRRCSEVVDDPLDQSTLHLLSDRPSFVNRSLRQAAT